MLKSFFCITKHHGSLRYQRLIFSVCRFKGNQPKKPAKILAAATSAAEKFHKESPKTDLKSIPKDGVTVISSPTASSQSEKDLLQFVKPVSDPDFTHSNTEVQEKSKEQLTKEDKKIVNLIDAVKPSDLEWHKQLTDFKLLPKYYKGLSKFRLTGLVVITTLAGYGMAPGAVEPLSLLCLVCGTGLTSASANSINQILEVPYDSQMARTKNRVLTRGYLTPFHAAGFASCCGIIGLSTLYLGTNPLTAALGATNLLLYTSVYTPLKRCSITNTWLGSIVGAIPPLMGWAACTGSVDPGGLLLASILYAWQFPHFNALSWNLRSEYSRAGYRMTSVINPDLCRRTALRYSIVILGLCTAAPLIDLTTWTFAVDSFPLNCYLVYCSWKFYKKGDSASSRKLFRLSLVHLPALMFLMFVGKKYSSKDQKKAEAS